jgi:hypothetical protein
VFINKRLGRLPGRGAAAVAGFMPIVNFVTMLRVFARVLAAPLLRDASSPMPMSQHDFAASRHPRFSRKEMVLSATFLVLIVYLANFTEMNRFSFYADDWGYLRWVFRFDFS